jgi:hypothetical protein
MSKKEIIKKGVNLYNKYFPNDKHVTEKQKKDVVNFFIKLNELTNSNSNLANKTIKVLQSKVKTYEEDINKGIYVYNNNCYCVKCKQYRAINNIDNKKLNKPIATLEIKN